MAAKLAAGARAAKGAGAFIGKQILDESRTFVTQQLQSNPEQSKQALTAIKWTAESIAGASPALLIAAPVAIVIGMLLSQTAQYLENTPLLADLRETLAAMQAILGEVTSDENAEERVNWEVIASMRARLERASELVGKVCARGRVSSWLHAGGDGAEMRAILEQLHSWIAVVTAACAAGMESRLQKEIRDARQEVMSAVDAIMAVERETLLQEIRAGRGSDELARPEELDEMDRDTWKLALAAQLVLIGEDSSKAAAIAEQEAAAAKQRYEDTLAALTGLMRGVEGGEARLAAAIAEANNEAAARHEEVVEVMKEMQRELMGQLEVTKLELMQMRQQLLAEVAAASSRARTASRQSGSSTADSVSAALGSVRQSASALLSQWSTGAPATGHSVPISFPSARVPNRRNVLLPWPTDDEYSGGAIRMDAPNPKNYTHSVPIGVSGRDDDDSRPLKTIMPPAEVADALVVFDNADVTGCGFIEKSDVRRLADMRPYLAPLASATQRAVLMSVADVVAMDGRIEPAEFVLVVAACREITKTAASGDNRGAYKVKPPSLDDVSAAIAAVAVSNCTYTADSDGNTALHRAAALDKTAAIMSLLDEGANPAVRNKRRQTPLHLAAAAGRAGAVANLLISQSLHKRSPLNPLDCDGCTPLDIALHAEAKGVAGAAETVEVLREQPGAMSPVWDAAQAKAEQQRQQEEEEQRDKRLAAAEAGMQKVTPAKAGAPADAGTATPSALSDPPPPATTLRVGDTVNLTRSAPGDGCLGDRVDGLTGKVLEVAAGSSIGNTKDKSGTQVLVVCQQTRKQSRYSVEDLYSPPAYRAEAPPSAGTAAGNAADAAPRLPVGSRVVLSPTIAAASTRLCLRAPSDGRSGMIMMIDASPSPYLVQCEQTGGKAWYCGGSLQLAEMQRLPLQTQVVVTPAARTSSFVGTGTITAVDSSTTPYLVYCEASQKFYQFQAHEIRVAPQ